MSSTTTNYGLHKIDLNDAPPDITVLNPNWDTIDELLYELSSEYLPLEGGELTGELIVNQNFQVRLDLSGVPYRSYLKPIPYSIGNDGNYSTSLIHYQNNTNTAQFMFNQSGAMIRDNVNAKAYALFGQHNTEVAASNIRSHLYTYGTTDMTAGTSELATGKIYLVYE